MNSEIGKSLKKINNLMRRNHQGCPTENMHRLRGWMLEYLSLNTDKDIFQKDLETEFCIRRSTATEILQKMERDGLIKRISVDSDKRLKKIILTKQSEQFREDFVKKMNRLDEIMSEDITDEELVVFQSVAEKIFINLEKHFYNKESKYD